ncbi:hypothetical protein N9499_09520 [Octadecabacter sp.]|nr:hypothetical protein [Octadecabacter sp.]
MPTCSATPLMMMTGDMPASISHIRLKTKMPATFYWDSVLDFRIQPTAVAFVKSAWA